MPVNLATSILGMNIQQLNQSGQDVWVFIKTLAVELSVTGFAWFCVAQLAGYVYWRGQRKDAFPINEAETRRTRNGYNLTTRIMLLVELLRRGRYHRLRGTNVWLGILLNDRFYTYYRKEFAESGELVREFRALSTCEYVLKYLDNKISDDPFSFSLFLLKNSVLT